MRHGGEVMVCYLLIVARNQPDLWYRLKQDFSGDEKVEVLLDRRRGERRRHVEAHEPERRRQPGIDNDLSFRGLVMMRKRQVEAVGFLPSPGGHSSPLFDALALSCGPP